MLGANRTYAEAELWEIVEFEQELANVSTFIRCDSNQIFLNFTKDRKATVKKRKSAILISKWSLDGGLRVKTR